MTLLAIGVANAILAWITVAVALVGALAAVALLTRVLQPILEIDRYADQVLGAAEAIVQNLDGVDELTRTRSLASSLPAGVERASGGRPRL